MGLSKSHTIIYTNQELKNASIVNPKQEVIPQIQKIIHPQPTHVRAKGKTSHAEGS